MKGAQDSCQALTFLILVLSVTSLQVLVCALIGALPLDGLSVCKQAPAQTQ